jgi:hypothetical protein
MKAICVVLTFLTAYAPIGRYAAAQSAWFDATTQPTPFSSPINSIAYARHGPLPGHPGYFQTIKYIDDGIKYVDSNSSFIISPHGEICFFTLPNSPQTIYEGPYRFWCAYPQSIGRVEAVRRSGGNFNEIHLWCGREYPQCAHKIGYWNPLAESGWFANSIAVPTAAYQHERAALEDLVFMMGKDIRTPDRQ